MTALAPVAALLVSTALLLTGNGVQITLLPVRGELEAFSNVDLGALGSAYFVGFALGCLWGPHGLRRVGHVRVFLSMAAVASATPLLHALFVEPAPWWLLRGLSGFCFAVLYVVIESWLNDQSSSESRGMVLSAYMFIQLTVITAGQMTLVLYDPQSFELFLVAAVLVSFAAVPVGFTRATTPAPVQATRVRLLRLYRVSPVGFMGCLAVGLANGSFWALGPVYAERIGLDVEGIALFMSAVVIGGALGQWPLGLLSDRTDRRFVVLGICAGAVATAGMLAHGAQDQRLLLGMGALFGFFAFPLYGVAIAHTNDHVAREDFVEASSGLLLVFAGGAVLGPLAASALMGSGVLGAGALFLFTAAVHGVLAAFTCWRLTRRAAAPMEDRGHFAEALQAAQTVSTVFEVPETGSPAEEPTARRDAT